MDDFELCNFKQVEGKQQKCMHSHVTSDQFDTDLNGIRFFVLFPIHAIFAIHDDV